MRSLQTITENLLHAQREFLSAADTILSEDWKRSPDNGCWSAGEVAAHLLMVERYVLQKSDEALQKPPKPRPFFKRFHLPMALVEARLIKRKSPIPLDPALVGPKEEMLAQLREVRGRTLSFMEEARGRDLSKYYRRHPFLGPLNTYEWFQMIASHQIRHTKQIREISAALQKSIEGLQK